AADRCVAVAEAPAHVAYASFMLSVDSRVGPLEIIAAILPCDWSYAEIAGDLADEIADHPVYRDWVDFYTTDEVLGLIRQMRQSFDEMAAQAGPGPRTRRRLGEIFTTSSRLEGAFGDIAYHLRPWPDLPGSHPDRHRPP